MCHDTQAAEEQGQDERRRIDTVQQLEVVLARIERSFARQEHLTAEQGLAGALLCSCANACKIGQAGALEAKPMWGYFCHSPYCSCITCLRPAWVASDVDRALSAGAGRRGCILRQRPAPGVPEAEAPLQQAAVPELARELVAARLAEAEAQRRLRCAARALRPPAAAPRSCILACLRRQQSDRHAVNRILAPVAPF